MVKELIKYVNDFLKKPEFFFEGLYDYGVFRKEEFHRYTKTVYELSKSELSIEERNKLIPVIWEISFEIQKHLMHHLDSDDVAEIENLEEDDIRQISNIIYYTANWFSYGKEIDEYSLRIGSWA